MKYSNIAVMVLAAKECGFIKSNAQFWSNYSKEQIFKKEVLNNKEILDEAKKILKDLEKEDIEGMICAYDNEFPHISINVKNNGDRPFLLFYKGNLDLLKNLNRNVSVIGLTNPSENIAKREITVVKKLVECGLTIVSGLANGCDEIAHKTCLDLGGKTIAFLPSTLKKISPAKNRILANEIVEKDGLLISEYYKEATSRREIVSRYIERDRLQAMFSKAIILIASYKKGQGDSGSRHAMEAARKYKIERFAMYNYKSDFADMKMALNKEYVNGVGDHTVEILGTKSIRKINHLINPSLDNDEHGCDNKQLTIL